jgi:HlyD family secretion protein
MKTFVWLLVIAIAGGAGWYFFGGGSARAAASKTQYRTAKVEKGEVVEGIAASGTVQPVVLVQVGTQVSGVIEKLFVDFNSKVKAGQTIALLDSRRMASQVAQDDAAIESSKANLERMKAQVVQARADVDRIRAVLAQSKSEIERIQALLTQSQRDLERQKTLVEKKLTAASDYDAAVANTGSLTAQLKSAQATIEQNEAQIAVAEATILQDEAQVHVAESAVTQAVAQRLGDKVNLDYATIVSPVDGVVVSRNVDVGQTVAASLSAPTLFLIAQDLTKVQVQASVPEADVGKIHESQKVHFAVDAYTDKSFEGVVSQVRLASTTVSNVVTYTVIVDASNPDGLLFPGMTANATFEIQRSEPDSLKVPATALRLTPAAELLEAAPAEEAPGEKTGEKPGEKASDKSGEKSKEDGARGGKREGGKRAGARGKSKKTFVYVTTPENRLRAIAVVPGISDGIFTVVVPVVSGSLEDGTELVTAILREEEPATTNPFAPPRMGGGNTRGMR